MSEMKLIKHWHLSWFDELDVEYIKGLDCEFEIHNRIKTFDVTGPNGQVYRVADRTIEYGLHITTTNSRQESLLMLKYASDIKLIRMFYANEWARYELQPDI